MCGLHKVCTKNYTIRSIPRRIIDDSYLCFEDLKQRTEKYCTDEGNTWERPCLVNEDCPFYKANENYPNEFGKCIGSFCEMPLGVKRLAYRKYTSKPICHNCPVNNPSCCIKTDLMASPDYMFKDDRMERIKNKDELEQRGISV